MSRMVSLFLSNYLVFLCLGCEQGPAPTPIDNRRLITDTEQYEEYSPDNPPPPPVSNTCFYFPDCDGDGRAAAYAEPVESICGAPPTDPPSDECVAWTPKNPLRLNQVDCDDDLIDDFENQPEQNCDFCRGLSLFRVWPSCDGDAYASQLLQDEFIWGCAPFSERLPTSNDLWISKTPITDYCDLEDERGRPQNPRWTPINPDDFRFGRNESWDCDDSDRNAYPGSRQLDICDGRNNDCDQNTDEDAPDVAPWFADCDGDGFPSVIPVALPKKTASCISNTGTRLFHDSIQRACPNLPTCQANDPNRTCQWVNHIDPSSPSADGLRDCNDLNPAISPGETGRDRCNGIDDDCDSEQDENPLFTENFTADCDGDGAPGGDFEFDDDFFLIEMCHDGFYNIFPGAEEREQIANACNGFSNRIRWVVWNDSDDEDDLDSAPFDQNIQ